MSSAWKFETVETMPSKLFAFSSKLEFGCRNAAQHVRPAISIGGIAAVFCRLLITDSLTFSLIGFNCSGPISNVLARRFGLIEVSHLLINGFAFVDLSDFIRLNLGGNLFSGSKGRLSGDNGLIPDCDGFSSACLPGGKVFVKIGSVCRISSGIG